jgi:hypothetical protein
MDLWKNCLDELRAAYKGVCSYCCLWVPTLRSVDHYQPKTVSPHRAYEWDHFRLTHQKINTYKGESTHVLDPFHIQDGWFTLDFANSFVKPNAELPQNVQDAVAETILILRLNRDDTLVQQRFDVVRDYSKNYCSMEFLKSRYPFIATELKRQGLQNSIKGTIP